MIFSSPNVFKLSVKYLHDKSIDPCQCRFQLRNTGLVNIINYYDMHIGTCSYAVMFFKVNNCWETFSKDCGENITLCYSNKVLSEKE